MVRADELNRAIEAAARRLTSGAPAADLRARVLAQIAVEHRRSWLWTWAPAAGTAVGLAAAIAAYALVRTVTPEFAEPTRHAIVHGPMPAPLAADVDAIGSGGPIGAGHRPDEPAVPLPSPAVLAWLERALPTLPVIDDLTMRSIQPEALGVTQLQVRPLATAPLDVAPIDAGGSR